MLKKYLLSILLLAGLVSFSFVPVFASLPSDDEQKHVSFKEESVVNEEEEEEKAEVNADEGTCENDKNNEEENNEEKTTAEDLEKEVVESEKNVKSTCPFCNLI